MVRTSWSQRHIPMALHPKKKKTEPTIKSAKSKKVLIRKWLIQISDVIFITPKNELRDENYESN